ncbi:hypothetical protein BP6252_11243 [Coleophoma cylindrospora]|uniref:Uncharacterized protein n=1 Tax=Coleophoma cylindrospora TaxID=1849047 RepID=A0A3D8QPU1_9HELO|nr:hypothetical protein BP6252_11243 [Coleophoma cylindrospora]
MMKMWLVCGLVFLSSLSCVLAWSDWAEWVPDAVTEFIDNPMRRSRIPRFILDAKHPWILENKRKLESLPDAEAFLCGLDAPSDEPVVHVNNGLELPRDLFHYLEIDNRRLSRPGWRNALERLREMKRCPQALARVKTFKVNIYVHDRYSDWFLRVREPSRPYKESLKLCGDVLEAMTGLESLKWEIDAEHAHWFEEAFKHRNLTLPSPKHLLIGPLSHYLVGMCPNVEAIENIDVVCWKHSQHQNPGLLLVRSTSSAKNLTRLALHACFEGWSPELAREVLEYMPQLTSLELKNCFESMYLDPAYSVNPPRPAGKLLRGILAEISNFPNLTHLDLPASYELDLGFDGGPICGNAYDGPGGARYQREVLAESYRATELGGVIVAEVLPHLTGFTVGGHQPNITRDEGGISNVTWFWTGKLDEWLLARIPDYHDEL